MIKVSFCMRRLPHLSREEFQEYYRKVHPTKGGPNAIEALGIRRYVQLHAVSEELNREFGESRGGEDDFDAVAELWVDSVEAVQRDWTQGEGLEVLKKLMEDEKNFVDWKRSTIFMSKELVFLDGPSTPPMRPARD